MNKEYIWYCPTQLCGSIILKTSKPFISDGTFKCKHCNCTFVAEEIVNHNLSNMQKYIKENK